MDVHVLSQLLIGSERAAHLPEHLLIEGNHGDRMPLCWRGMAIAVGLGAMGTRDQRRIIPQY